MRTLFFIFFIIVTFLLIFKVNQLFKPKITAISYGISLIAVPILMLAGIYLLRLLNFNADKQFQEIYFAVLFTLMVIILLNLVVLFADAMTNKLLHFQETENTSSTDRNPVKFALDNKSGIKIIYRIVFFAGSILMFYGIWLGKK